MVLKSISLGPDFFWGGGGLKCFFFFNNFIICPFLCDLLFSLTVTFLALIYVVPHRYGDYFSLLFNFV